MSNETNPNPNRKYITTIEAEQISGLRRNYLTLLLRKGTLEGFRPSRDWFIYTDSLEKFLATSRKPGPKGPRKNNTTTDQSPQSAEANSNKEHKAENIPQTTKQNS